MLEDNSNLFSKDYYRNLSLKNRQLLSDDNVLNKSKTITEYFFSINEVKKAKKIFCYLSSEEKKEVKMDFIISHAFNNQKNVYIPYTDWTTKNIEVFELKEFPLPTHKFIKKFGIFEPQKKYFTEYTGDLDIIALPGSAGDNFGTRYGYGKGFFDIFLEKLKKENKKFITILLLFNCQFFENLPKENHDFPVDIIITENKIIYTLK